MGTFLDRKKPLKMDVKGEDVSFPLTGWSEGYLIVAMETVTKTLMSMNGSCDISAAIKGGMSKINTETTMKKLG